jgi:DNA repair protein RecO (recombination protein O)
MKIEDKGIILEITKYSERDVIVTIFSKDHGLYSGIFKNSHSKTNAGKVNPSNNVDFTWSARLAEHLGTFTLEVNKSIYPYIFQDNAKLIAVRAILTIIKYAIPERSPEPELYWLLEELLDKICYKENWITDYIDFEIELLAHLGYGLDLKKCVVTKQTENLHYISPKSAKAVSFDAGKDYHNLLFLLPQFLINKDHYPTAKDISATLEMTSYFIDKFLFQPHKLSLPNYRKILNNIFTK